MPDMSSEEELDIATAETMSDFEVGLPLENLSITVSRIKDEHGHWTTKIWFNRKARRFYAIGLLTEALDMLQSTNAEVVWSRDTPAVMEDIL